MIGSRYREGGEATDGDDYQPTISRRIGTNVFRFFLTLALSTPLLYRLTALEASTPAGRRFRKETPGPSTTTSPPSTAPGCATR